MHAELGIDESSSKSRVSFSGWLRREMNAPKESVLLSF
jgi:Rps23 Pro-64 3,4-dihydroxylase Tpa1-like proline 4-hydroxylase